MSRPETINNKMITLDGFEDYTKKLRYELPRLGTNNKIKNSSHCFALGMNNNIVGASYNLLFGQDNESQRNKVIALGQDLKVNYSINGLKPLLLIGQFNDDSHNYDDDVFVIGGGPSSLERKDILRIAYNGNISTVGNFSTNNTLVINESGFMRPAIDAYNGDMQIQTHDTTLSINKGDPWKNTTEMVFPYYIHFYAGKEEDQSTQKLKDSYAFIGAGEFHFLYSELVSGSGADYFETRSSVLKLDEQKRIYGTYSGKFYGNFNGSFSGSCDSITLSANNNTFSINPLLSQQKILFIDTTADEIRFASRTNGVENRKNVYCQDVEARYLRISGKDGISANSIDVSNWVFIKYYYKITLKGGSYSDGSQSTTSWEDTTQEGILTIFQSQQTKEIAFPITYTNSITEQEYTDNITVKFQYISDDNHIEVSGLQVGEMIPTSKFTRNVDILEIGI